MREMKWHLYNDNYEPLCWENDNWESEKLIDFDSIEEAINFWELTQKHYPEIGKDISRVKQDINYYNGGYISGAEALKLMTEELNERP